MYFLLSHFISCFMKVSVYFSSSSSLGISISVLYCIILYSLHRWSISFTAHLTTFSVDSTCKKTITHWLSQKIIIITLKLIQLNLDNRERTNVKSSILSHSWSRFKNPKYLNNASLCPQVAYRALMMSFIGIVLGSTNSSWVDVRLPGVLQRLAAMYLIVGALECAFMRTSQNITPGTSTYKNKYKL